MAETGSNSKPDLLKLIRYRKEQVTEMDSAPAALGASSMTAAVTSGTTKVVSEIPINGTTATDAEQAAVKGNEPIQNAHESTLSTTTSKASAPPDHASPDHNTQQARETCNGVDMVLGYIYEIKNHMTDFEIYIETQKAKNKPLFQWAKYSDYRALSRSISALEEAAATLKLENLPKDEVKLYLRKATQFSLSISKVAVFAMGVMRQKFDTCIADIEASELSAEGKDNAKVLVTNELEKLIKHCTRATGRVYAALDLLRECLPVEESSQEIQLANIKKLISESEGRILTSRPDWLRIGLVLILGAVASAAVAFLAAHLASTHKDAAVLDLVQRSQTITNLTAKIHMMNMQEVTKRYKDLEEFVEEQGLRLDNIVEALGPTNDEGLYYSTTWKVDESDSTGGVHHRIRKLAEFTDRELRRLHEDIARMGKTVGRMDANLATRLEKIERVKG